MADWHDDISDRFCQAQAVLTSGGANSVALVLVRAGGHAVKAEGCQSLLSPGRAGAVPRRPFQRVHEAAGKTSMAWSPWAASAANRASPSTIQA